MKIENRGFTSSAKLVRDRAFEKMTPKGILAVILLVVTVMGAGCEKQQDLPSSCDVQSIYDKHLCLCAMEMK